jgi:AcrR family transcriptional regulator
MDSKSSQLSRGDWVAAALEALALHGIEGVRVQTIAKQLGVTTGSFYWHFRNRRELLVAVVDFWEAAMTDSVMAGVRDAGGTPPERILALMEDVVLRRRNRYDPAMRSWAQSDPEAAERVRQVEARRRRYVEGLFRAAGFTKREAHVRGRLLADSLMGQGVILDKDSEREQRRLLRQQWEMLVSQ